VGLTGGRLDLHAVAQQLVGAEVGLVEREAGGVGGRFELVERGGDVRVGVAARLEVVAQQVVLDVAVVRALAPIAEVAIAETVGARPVGEEADDAILRLTFGAGCGCLRVEGRGLHDVPACWVKGSSRRQFPRVPSGGLFL
jgi:hypothetical protein